MSSLITRIARKRSQIHVTALVENELFVYITFKKYQLFSCTLMPKQTSAYLLGNTVQYAQNIILQSLILQLNHKFPVHLLSIQTERLCCIFIVPAFYHVKECSFLVRHLQFHSARDFPRGEVLFKTSPAPFCQPCRHRDGSRTPRRAAGLRAALTRSPERQGAAERDSLPPAFTSELPKATPSEHRTAFLRSPLTYALLSPPLSPGAARARCSRQRQAGLGTLTYNRAARPPHGARPPPRRAPARPYIALVELGEPRLAVVVEDEDCFDHGGAATGAGVAGRAGLCCVPFPPSRCPARSRSRAGAG